MLRRYKNREEQEASLAELEEKSKQLVAEQCICRPIFYIPAAIFLGLSSLYFAISNRTLGDEIEQLKPKHEVVSAESYDSLQGRVNALTGEVEAKQPEAAEISAQAASRKEELEKRKKEAEEKRASIEKQIREIEDERKTKEYGAVEIPNTATGWTVEPAPAKPTAEQPKPAETPVPKPKMSDAERKAFEDYTRDDRYAVTERTSDGYKREKGKAEQTRRNLDALAKDRGGFSFDDFEPDARDKLPEHGNESSSDTYMLMGGNIGLNMEEVASATVGFEAGVMVDNILATMSIFYGDGPDPWDSIGGVQVTVGGGANNFYILGTVSGGSYGKYSPRESETFTSFGAGAAYKFDSGEKDILFSLRYDQARKLIVGLNVAF